MAEGDHDTTSIVKAIKELKARDPFVPFRIALTSGDKYLIEHGGKLVEMKSEFFYALPGGEDFVFLRNNQIAAVENPEARRTPRRKAS
jgi:hypothetical protein